MTTMQKLESLGYRFRLDGERVLMRRYGSREPPKEAAALIAKLDKEEVRRALQDRAAGYAEASDGVLWAYGEDVLPVARKVKAAEAAGEIWVCKVKYHTESMSAEFHFQPADWTIT